MKLLLIAEKQTEQIDIPELLNVEDTFSIARILVKACKRNRVNGWSVNISSPPESDSRY